MAEIKRLFMNKVLVSAVLVFVAGLLFSCSSDAESGEVIMVMDASSSGSPLSSSSNGKASSSSYSSSYKSSSSFSNEPLNCDTVPSSGYVNSPITPPALTCGNGETPTSITWLGSPVIDWDNPKGGTYSDIGVMANCGTETDLMAFCSGTLTVRYVLSCSMPGIGYEGEAIKPVLSCSDGSVPFHIVFSGYLPNWDNPAPGSYAVYAEANCGQGVLPKISCGTLTVNPTFIDTRDNKTYRTVVIGTQTWMAENLNYNADGSRCYGDNTGGDSQNMCGTYGRLYDWETAMTVCPTGWHLPSKAEWEVMTGFIGGANTEGKKLKATSGWGNNGNGTDDYGFSALPGGYGDGYGNSDGRFRNVGNHGDWWSASEYEHYSDGAYNRTMHYVDSADWGSIINKPNLFSVRCLQD